jgi:anti-anti-sigma factor
MENVEIDLNENILFVKGNLNFYNVEFAYQQGLRLMKTLKDIKIDLKGLAASDSSGLALLSAWVRICRQKNKAILFINMPNFMQDISRVCGLDGVLPVLWEN